MEKVEIPGEGASSNLKVSQDSTACRWLRQFPEAAKRSCDTAASAWIATKLAGLRKTLRRAALKGKKMVVLRLGEDHWREG
jgi:hypothetical protein